MIPLFKPFVPELPLLNDVLTSGKLSYGEYTMAFEKELKAFFATDYLLTTNTYSSAIDVLVSTIGLEPGDEIIMSPMCCLASSQPYISKGLKIIWADIDPFTGTLSPESVKKRITKSTKLIVHNHFCGNPGYIDEINGIARKHSIMVIDDGIECFGSSYKGKRIGNCGTDITVFSLSAVRIPNTIEGGILVFKDKELYEKALIISDLGINRFFFRDELNEINPKCDITFKGFNAKMSNLNGYIGYECMKKIEWILSKQQHIARIWNDTIDAKYQRIEVIEGCLPNYWVYGLLVENKKEAIAFFREKGFYASGIHIDNTHYSVFGKRECLPGVMRFMQSYVGIPCGWWVDEKDIREFDNI